VLIEAGQGLTRRVVAGERSAGGRRVADLAEHAAGPVLGDGSTLHQELGKGLGGLRLGRGVEKKTGARNWAEGWKKTAAGLPAQINHGLTIPRRDDGAEASLQPRGRCRAREGSAHTAYQPVWGWVPWG